ncbi:glycosyltransferase 87 family protein [Hymenobacter koreensis]|uniref:DUF2029 domain-containing protein n=1 Tax=Hymenobacter koreensis TaxID=1084523 RepID=A0ABP8JB55_9BACT
MKPGRHYLLLASLAALVLVASQGLLAYATERSQTVQLLGLLAVGTAAYLVLLRGNLPLRAGLLLALVLRLIWLPAMPRLSDDYHRFRWDGLLVATGQNPYQHRPDEFRAGGGALTGPAELSPALFKQLNSPRYYSLYPPVSQAAFGVAAWLFPASETGFVLVLRGLLLLAEAASAGLLLRLLLQWHLPVQRAFWYLLHPMVVAELTGNLHFEALVVTGLLLTCWLLVQHRVVGAAVVLGGAVAAKLTPLLLLPLLLRRLGLRACVLLGAGTLLTLGLLFTPFASVELVQHFGSSLNLYFHSFEFNASIYYLFRALGIWLTGYNQIAHIGTLLLGLAVLGILVFVALERRPTLAGLPGALLLLFTGYYALSTTVHPWYLAPLVALSCFSGWRYPAAWASLAALSYAAYRTPAYTEDLRLVALEYLGVLLVMALDWRRRGETGNIAPPAKPIQDNHLA